MDNHQENKCYLIDLEKNYTLNVKSLHFEKSYWNKQSITTLIDMATITFSENNFSDLIKDFYNLEFRNIYFFYPETDTILYLNGCIMNGLDLRPNTIILSFIYYEYFKSSDPAIKEIIRHLNLNKLLDFSIK